MRDVLAVQTPALLLDAAGDRAETLMRHGAAERRRLHRRHMPLQDLQVVEPSERFLRRVSAHARAAPPTGTPLSAASSSAVAQFLGRDAHLVQMFGRVELAGRRRWRRRAAWRA